jgi:DNA-binding winged helix-turn-helix (wHTH) protein
MMTPAVDTYRFGRYLLDVRHRTLMRGNSLQPLPEKPFRILQLLLEADGGIVEKDVFLSQIWPNEDVGEANITQHVFMLRSVLGGDANGGSCIITVPGKGYRLAARVERKVGLVMRELCERCDEPLGMRDEARICSYECTFCPACAASVQNVCPNCGGELVARPRRNVAADY